MNKKSSNLYYHIAYWIFVLLVLSITFGFSWGNKTAALFFVSMLLPIVIGTSYFFNYVLVPKFYLTKKYKRFAFYTFCTAIISVYLEMLVLVFSFVYLVNVNYQNLSPNAVQVTLLAVVLYLLVFIGSFLLMMRQITENRQLIQQLTDEKEKLKKSFLEIMSNRRMVKIPYNEIIYIESLSDYIKVVTINGEIVSKEKISLLVERLPDIFLRIHRSFIINTEKVKEHSLNEVLVDDIRLNIGRSYRKAVKELLNSNRETTTTANRVDGR
ncbi:LytR/AlgR family response regulator transcription factor [Maribellus maritimus]|uniref:LytR/AlgR family response regulator transcription factor n=1 Tax=Maribellus maritimus TaxID=2870838 RepID=UPI001EEA8BB9|nr:LytTR family DNA-binding domain-containing protein [Maribellus maritimus]MCG6189001.1 LytTR family transcriptional regulator [Maribellus maritimus]